MFRDARIVGERPYWIGDHIWNRLLEHWNSPSYGNKQITSQRNRASEKGGTLHTGGSITTHEHALRMEKELGREAYIDEVFYQTHLRKGSGQFANERSRRTHEEFSTRLSQVRSEQGSCAEASEHNDEEDVIRTQCWVDVVSGKNKGRLYGTRELGKGYTTGRGIHKQQASSSNNVEEAVNRLTQRLEECDQAYENLRSQFQNFKNLVMAFLPVDAQTRLQQ
ncbi:uncharacterized protein LOC114175069 [Vigna unguiculata]|uniref:uncharacterized protein LOC114175069 n=1 Tax=Vigna unguiculata TaxID=3917 RepID=UPI0010162B58|nr:uncharacterized protein LOC114175069 [Vigna unguiculata]